MLSGRQRTALWVSVALGTSIVTLASQRSRSLRGAPARVELPGSGRPGVAEIPSSLELGGVDPQVLAAAARHNLDPLLVEAIISVESSDQASAVSPKGAVGLMQVLPETAAWLGLPDPADPAVGLEAGCRYLAALLDHFGGDTELALAAYNAGPGAVRRWGTVPPYPETRRFVARVSQAYHELSGMDLVTAGQPGG
ncbi:MAG: lytic transglycosylase domain-containing protein [Acidobacteriota bacterium]